MTLNFPFYIALIPAGVTLLLILLGVLLWKKANRRLGFLVLLFGALVGIVFGPMLFLDTVTVDQKHIQQTTGLWFSPTTKGFDFANLQRVRIVTRKDRNDRDVEIWIAEYTNQAPVEVDPGDLWESNGARITKYLRSLKIEVVNE